MQYSSCAIPILYLYQMPSPNLWLFISSHLSQNKPVMLLCVVESNGSSPGRQGFKMAVAEDGFCGSIGGGIMEHKFVEMAKEKLFRSGQRAEIKKQFHLKSAAKDQSGMICSGEQTILLFLLKKENLPEVNKIISTLEGNKNGTLQFSPSTFSFTEGLIPGNDFDFNMKTEFDFSYSERLGFKNHLYIAGGGHCALALSKLMSGMDFCIHVFEEREGLNTWEENTFAQEKTIVKDYSALTSLIPSGEQNYVVIMTFGYRTDDAAVRALAGKTFSYFGVLGSEAKMKKLFAEWRSDNFPESWLEKISSPIGIPIKSETPEEIAVSIAAEIINVKNNKTIPSDTPSR